MPGTGLVTAALTVVGVCLFGAAEDIKDEEEVGGATLKLNEGATTGRVKPVGRSGTST